MTDDATPAQSADSSLVVRPFADFSLQGGPLYRLGAWFGLARHANVAALGFALGWLPWFILVTLAAAQGEFVKLMSISVLGGHVRLLVVIPLMFLCETTIDIHVREFVEMLVRTGVAPRRSLPELTREILRLRSWTESWIPDVTSLVAAALISLFAAQLHLTGKTATMDPSISLAYMPLAGLWYWLFCLPLFRFLLFRWLWRLAFWWLLLWRLARADLQLVPTHPDGVGGLGYLEVVQAQFAALAFAISALAAAAFAEEISSGRSVFDVIYPEMALAIALSIVLFLGPPCIFAFKLRVSREQGLRDYMGLASRYVFAFERKWLGDTTGARRDTIEPLLGTADLQSLADLGNSVNVVRNMRMAPVSMRLFVAILAAAVAPMLPLFLLKYPLADLSQRLFMKLTGL